MSRAALQETYRVGFGMWNLPQSLVPSSRQWRNMRRMAHFYAQSRVRVTSFGKILCFFSFFFFLFKRFESRCKPMIYHEFCALISVPPESPPRGPLDQRIERMLGSPSSSSGRRVVSRDSAEEEPVRQSRGRERRVRAVVSSDEEEEEGEQVEVERNEMEKRGDEEEEEGELEKEEEEGEEGESEGDEEEEEVKETGEKEKVKKEEAEKKRKEEEKRENAGREREKRKEEKERRAKEERGRGERRRKEEEEGEKGGKRRREVNEDEEGVFPLRPEKRRRSGAEAETDRLQLHANEVLEDDRER